MSRRRGFTLVELLMVVTIIADPDHALPAGGPVGAGGGADDPVPEQPAPARHRAGQLRLDAPRPAARRGQRQGADLQPAAGLPRRLGRADPAVHRAGEPLSPDRLPRRASTPMRTPRRLATSLRLFLCPSDSAARHHELHGLPPRRRGADRRGQPRRAVSQQPRRRTTTSPTGRRTRSCWARPPAAWALGWASGTRATLRNAGHRINESDWMIPPSGSARATLSAGDPGELPDPGTMATTMQGRLLARVLRRRILEQPSTGREFPVLRRLGPVPQGDDRSARPASAGEPCRRRADRRRRVLSRGLPVFPSPRPLASIIVG